MDRILTLACCALLTLPGALALDLVSLTPAPAPAAPAELPEGCVAENDTYSCGWTIATQASPATTSWSWLVPTFPKTLATVKAVLSGVDNGWAVRIGSTVNVSSPAGTTSSFTTTSGESRHSPDPQRANYITPEETTHVFEPLGTLVFGSQTYANVTTRLFFDTTGANGPRSTGTFQVYYIARPVPEGAAPARPAATATDPQLQGIRHDAPRAELDLVAGWLDDAKLGDGLMDVHLAVAGNLTNIDWNGSSAPGAPPQTSAVARTVEIDYALHFRLHDTRYQVAWTFRPLANASGYRQSSSNCALQVVPIPKSAGGMDVKDPTTAPLTKSVPRCSVNETTMSAEFPELSIGSPGPGVLFEELSANADEVLQADASRGSGYAQPRDSLGPARFQFALGGPDTWDKLNGCRFCPYPPNVPPWYVDPLAAENLPNTLQVGGAGVAAGAFFVGLFLVRRRRAQMTTLLREVADVEEKHERDTRAALLALGQLDSKFADMFHKGKLTESQYQTIAQRVATAATRFALRQGLGLDDGAAGDRSLQGADAPEDASSVVRDRAPRTIPIQTGDSPAAVRPHER